MRQQILMTSLIGLAGLLCACAEGPPPAAVSAQRFATPAAETARAPPVGYAPDARRIADCLASFPGYDYRTDRMETGPQAGRRCPL